MYAATMYTNTRSCTPAQVKAGILRFPMVYDMPILSGLCPLGIEKLENAMQTQARASV